MTPCKVPLVEKLRSVPKDYRTAIEIQWDEDGTATGHRFIPVGYMMHEAAYNLEQAMARIADLEAELEHALAQRIVGQDGD